MTPSSTSGILGSLAAAYGVAAASRVRSQETAGHAELVLSTATSRLRWAASHMLVALTGTAAVLTVTGAAIGLGHGLTVDDPGGQVLRLTGAALVHAPAAWVLVGIVLVLVGWLPRAVPAAARGPSSPSSSWASSACCGGCPTGR